MTAYQLLLNAAELHVPAGTASIIVAAAPLVSVAIAARFLSERLTATKVVAVSLARSGAFGVRAGLGALPRPAALRAGFVLWGYAVASLAMATSTSLLYFVPAFAVLIGFVWLGEVPLVGELLGSVVVIAGVLFVSLGDRILACVRRAGVAALADARPAD